MITYVYEGTEVRLTGRVAKRDTNDTTRRGTSKRTEHLVEIEPLQLEVKWKKWVKKSDLFEILQETKLEQN